MPDSSNPFEQYGQLQNSQGTNESRQLRMMMQADRLANSGVLRPHMGRGGIGGSSPMLGAMLGMGGEPDYSRFTYDPQARAQAQAAGVNPLAPEDVRTNAILPNSGFFGNHPRLSAMLEGGMFAGAATRSGDTIGENISNVLGGIMQGHMARQGMLNSQFSAPFQQANVLEGLQDRMAMRQERDDTSQLRHTQMEYDNERLRQLKKNPPAHEMIPLNRDTAGFLEWDSAKGGYNKVENPYYDPKTNSTRTSNPWSGLESIRPLAESMGYHDPETMTKKQWSAVDRAKEQRDIRIAGGKSGASEAARIDTPGNLTPQQQSQMKPIDEQMSKLDSKDHTSLLRQMVMLDPKWAGKPIDQQTQEVESRRDAQRADLQKKRDTIVGNQPTKNVSTQKVGTYNPTTGKVEYAPSN